jgi:alanine racemase
VIAYDLQTVHYLNECAQRLNKKAALHVKIDTGLSRMGVLYNQANTFITACSRLSHCILVGIFSHFANSEGADKTFAMLQLSRLQKVITDAASQGITFKFTHISSSAGHTTLPETHHTLTRLGIGLYGLWPSLTNQHETLAKHPDFRLRPVMEWKTKINQIKQIPAGSFVGYDLTHTLIRNSRIAILPIGYHDGYDRRLSNKAVVKINDQYAPVIGRVAMNLTMVDITDISNAKETDTVTLLGADEKISAQTLAQLCGTINYEFVSRIHSRIARIVI